MNKKLDTSVILLAAGHSKRMGECKYLLPFGNYSTFLEKILSEFANNGFKKIIIVTQNENKKKIESILSKFPNDVIEIVINPQPEKERFYSLQLGLQQCKDSQFYFIHNSDMPFVSKSIIMAIYNERFNANYITPKFKQVNGHPILIDKSIVNQLLECSYNSILRDELNTFKRHKVEVDSELFSVDIDTPQDYQDYIKTMDY